MAASTRRPHADGVSGLIALLSGAHFSHHVLTALLVPLLPFIRNEFHLTYAQAGLVTSAFTIAYGVTQLPAGWLADRVGPRYLLLVGITGVAAAGVVIGVHIVGGSTSHFLAPIIAAGLVTAAGWRGSFIALSVPVGILGLVLFVLIHRSILKTAPTGAITNTNWASESATDDSAAVVADPVVADPVSENGPPPASNSSRKAQMVFFLIIAGMVGSSISTVIPFIPLYLADIRGVDQRLAASFIAVLYAAGFFAAPMGGWLSGRFGRKRVMAIVGLAMGPAIALVVVTPFPAGMTILLLVLGILMFTKMPTAEAHIASELSERRRATVLGVYFFANTEGSALFTPLVGAAIDKWGFTVGIVGLGAILLSAVAVCAVAMAALEGRCSRGT